LLSFFYFSKDKYMDNGIDPHKFYRWEEKSLKGTKMIDIIFTLSEDWKSDPSQGQYRAIELEDVNGNSELKAGMSYSYKWHPGRKGYKIKELDFDDLTHKQKVVFWTAVFNGDMRFYFDD
jgi:hypothetical protein